MRTARIVILVGLLVVAGALPVAQEIRPFPLPQTVLYTAPLLAGFSTNVCTVVNVSKVPLTVNVRLYDALTGNDLTGGGLTGTLQPGQGEYKGLAEATFAGHLYCRIAFFGSANSVRSVLYTRYGAAGENGTAVAEAH